MNAWARACPCALLRLCAKPNAIPCLASSSHLSPPPTQRANINTKSQRNSLHNTQQALYPAVSLKNAEALLNFGASPFRFAPPPGFVGLAAAPEAALARAGVEPQPAAASSAAGGGGGGRGTRRPLCLILEPSRDLAEQTHE